ncbi:MAG: polysaccharide deacetylase family protein, partial [Acidimicrobiia bacterium]|nr:polysaccharide deacetylase family protein [Acidimicrobiia bacterium]
MSSGPGSGLARTRAWLRGRFSTSAAVLMYHAIGAVDVDPWGLFVTPENFADHLRVLNDRARPMTLAGLGEHRTAGTIPDRATAVTFDDGYLNNLEVAKPLMEAASIPATVFVISEPMERVGEFWWDELGALLLRPGDLPPTITVEAIGTDGTLELGPAVRYSHEQWSGDRTYVDGDIGPSARMVFYRRLWQRLMDLGDGERRARALDEIARWAGVERTVRDSHRAVSIGELAALDGGMIEVGGHTMTHPLLPTTPADDRRLEIVDNKRHLEEVLERPVDTFSYPFGAHDDEAAEAVANA